ncbi:MAG: GMC family oxidoreductase [Myxococcales bacterium]|nr:GMC family oxidoreductase [Myxococcales bacterium]
MIVTHEQVRAPLDEACDYVIVGSGPSGATVARVLAEAGEEVVIVEEGAPWPLEKRKPQLYHTMKGAWRDMGTNAAVGSALIPILQGCVVGGSSVINSAICWRMPEDVHHLWSEDRGIAEAIPYAALERAFERVERELNVHPVEAPARGNQNNLMEAGCEKLGYTGHRIERNERDCRGSGRCLQGCPHGAKLSMDLSYIPHAMKNGARVYATCRVERIETTGERATGVVGTFHDPILKRRAHPMRIRARKGVVIAASAIQTPLLLLRSRLANSSKQVGRHFQAHPGAGVVGIFDHEVRMWEGATQGYETAHFRSQGYKLEAVALPPELAAARLPGVGRKLARGLSMYKNMTLIGAQVRAKAHGRVMPAGGGRPFVWYSLTERDVQVLKHGLKKICEINFAAGAKAVLPGIHGFPEALTSPDQLHLFDHARMRARDFSLIATHLFGTCRMGSLPRDSVVGPNFETHDVRGLYVVDSSVFPTNMGVNPQHSIMGMAWVAAEGMLSGR